MSLLDTASLIVTPNGYKEGKLYSVIPSDGSGDMSVTRATTATRVNSAGLVELVPYNLVQYSQEFDNAYWTKSNTSIVANQTTAPDGTLTADKSVIDSSTSFHDAAIGTYSKVDGQVYTLSIYAKKSVGIESVYFYNPDGNRVAKFNMNNGAYIGNASTNGYSAYSSYTTETLANGWYRFTATFTATSTASTSFILGISTNTTDTVTTLTGNGTDNVFIWGAQLVEGSVAKDYQKTETRLNIPRLDYSNGTCPSLLVEPQRTNLLKYSSSFDISPWTAIGTTITPNTQVAPDGTTTGDTYSTSQSILLLQTLSASTSTTYTVSMWVKLGTATNICLVANNTAAWNTIGGQSFDSADGLNTSTWTRIEFTFTTPSSLPAGAINFHIGGNAETGLTQSTGTVFIWGAQLEAGSYATSIIPTLGASVTRNADVILKTGISSLIGQTEGTLFVDFYNYGNNSTTTGCPICIANGGFYGNAIYIEQYLGNWYAVVWNGSSQQFISSPLSLSVGRHKLALAYKSNDIAFYSDGVLVGTDTSATIPTCDGAYIGAVGTSTTPEQLAVNAAALWKTRLTNDQLASLTTL